MTLADAKLQRWVDLIAALVSHRFGTTLTELESFVPGYGGDQTDATRARMFERDKDELRALGIPIRVRANDTEDGEEQRYYIRASELYLPYLSPSARIRGKPSVPPAGYRSLPTLVFEPDELSALIQAARVTKSAGVDALSSDATSAIQKLTYDLGAAIGSAVGESDDHAVRLPEQGTAPTVTTLGDALLRRKTVSFAYRSMNRDV